MRRIVWASFGGLLVFALLSLCFFLLTLSDASLSLRGEKQNLGAGGRVVALQIQGSGLKTCQLSSSPQLAELPKKISPCSSSQSTHILLPENSSRHRQLWKFEVTAELVNKADKALRESVKISQAPDHRVAIFGDSFTYQMGLTEMSLLRATHGIVSTYHAWPADGICNALQVIRRRAREFKPEIAILEYIGSNFDSCTKTPSYGDPTVSPKSLQHWLVRQKEDFEVAINVLRLAGVKKIYLDQGPECVACNNLGPGTRATYAKLAKEYPGLVVVVRPASAIEGPHGQWVSGLPCLPGELAAHHCNAPSVHGIPFAQVRGGPDGFHICDTFEPGVFEPPGCPTYSSGAFRYAAASVTPIIKNWHLKPLPVFLPSLR
ncbi:MAG: hypothetical protein WCO31_04160 [Actinomycetes bacterium]